MAGWLARTVRCIPMARDAVRRADPIFQAQGAGLRRVVDGDVRIAAGDNVVRRGGWLP